MTSIRSNPTEVDEEGNCYFVDIEEGNEHIDNDPIDDCDVINEDMVDINWKDEESDTVVLDENQQVVEKGTLMKT